jgi:hypothetical protein
MEATKVTKTERPTAATRASILGKPTKYLTACPELQRERARVQALIDSGELEQAVGRSQARARRRQASAQSESLTS